ncbi:hypothetical protein M422DRAFT_188185, partial [Sphaerobolus stellatus SS14]
RYDCVIINTSPITFARLEFIFTCEDMSKRRCDIAPVRGLEYSKWRSRTEWEGYTALEENSYSLSLLKYPIRGCHLIPTFEEDEGKYYLNDLVDSDASVRFFLNK